MKKQIAQTLMAGLFATACGGSTPAAAPAQSADTEAVPYKTIAELTDKPTPAAKAAKKAETAETTDSPAQEVAPKGPECPQIYKEDPATGVLNDKCSHSAGFRNRFLQFNNDGDTVQSSNCEFIARLPSELYTTPRRLTYTFVYSSAANKGDRYTVSGISTNVPDANGCETKTWASDDGTPVKLPPLPPQNRDAKGRKPGTVGSGN